MKHPQKALCRRAASFLSNSSAASTAEYALLLTLVIIVGAAGFFGLSTFTRWVFQHNAQIASSSEPGSDRTSSSSTKPSETSFYLPHRIIERAIRTLDKAELAIQFAAGLLGLAMGSGLVIVCWQVIHSRRRPRPEEEPTTIYRASQTSEHETLYAKRAVLRRVLRRAIDMRQATELSVAKLMSENVIGVHPKTPIYKVVQTIKEKCVSHVLVVDRKGLLLGIISHRDLSRRTGRYAEDIMTRSPVTVHVSTPATQAISLMLEKDISCLPVVEDGHVRGVLTKTDVMIGFQALIQALELVLTEPAEEEELDSFTENGVAPDESPGDTPAAIPTEISRITPNPNPSLA